jgi:membrane associated rhomboid family serine protease
MFIPLRTDRPPKRRPLVTQSLILVNLAVYLVGAAGFYFDLFENPQALVDFGHFDPQEFKAWQLVSYQFLHDPHGILHIAFNMLFLWVFGAAVEDRLGRVGFLGFYLTGGIVAALAHAMIKPSDPVIGASGSIAGVTGAFLALFPRSRIQVLIFFFIVGVISIPSLWFIGIYITVDVLRQLFDFLGRGGRNVAYMAHLAGYVYDPQARGVRRLLPVHAGPPPRRLPVGEPRGTGRHVGLRPGRHVEASRAPRRPSPQAGPP